MERKRLDFEHWLQDLTFGQHVQVGKSVTIFTYPKIKPRNQCSSLWLVLFKKSHEKSVQISYMYMHIYV